jgi:hypothetical protein
MPDGNDALMNDDERLNALGEAIRKGDSDLSLGRSRRFDSVRQLTDYLSTIANEVLRPASSPWRRKLSG